MPGIVGIISSSPEFEGQRWITAMASSMMHELRYSSDIVAFPAFGIYGASVSDPDNVSSTHITSSQDGELALILTGECFPESDSSHVSPQDNWVLRRYQTDGPRFVEQLNGLFSGLLIDRRQNRVILFNDRYGVERIYWAETKDGFFFASEAKAILRVLPDCRVFDNEGVAQYLNFNCTLGERTLFRNVSLLPGASRWTFKKGDIRNPRKETYFSPKTWESQSTFSEKEFGLEFQQTFKRVLPRYFNTRGPLGISLTAGLDTRMIMACRPALPEKPVCFTYSGEHVDTLDAKIAGQIARTCGFVHHALHIGPDFFCEFANLADKTVYITDGCFGVTGAHEIYMSRLARQLAPVRLTGNFGGEILRGVSTFKPVPYADGLINGDLLPVMKKSSDETASLKEHQITFAAFREVPWNLSGNLQAGKSQIGFRTPYLDNELVALAYRAPETLRRSRTTALRLVQDNDSALAAIATDRGYLGNSSDFSGFLRRAYGKITFKLDYINNEGLPNWLSPLDPMIQRAGHAVGILGLHKHLHYRSWFRNELASYIREKVSDCANRQTPFWNASFLLRMADDHIAGRKNYVLELNSVLTLDAVSRLLLKDQD